MKTPRQWLRGVIQGGAETPGRVAAAFSAWSCGNLGSGPLGIAPWIQPAWSKDATGQQPTRNCLETLYAVAAYGASPHGHDGQPPVDSVVDAPYAGFMNLQVPPELEAKLTRLAAETGRTADQVAIDLLASSMDHDEWFRGEVEKGRASAREGRLLEHDDVVARMDQRYRG